MSRTDTNPWEDKERSPARRKRGGVGDNSEVAFVTKLGAAKHALTVAESIPDIADLRDHAEAVRAAARSLHISAEGINAWLRFCVDAERKAWRVIEKMRAAGELATQTSSPQRSSAENRPTLILADLIDRNPTQRASQWAMLATLTEHQLNEAERIANEEDRILTRKELITLAKAGIPAPSKAAKGSASLPPIIQERSQADLKLIAEARRLYCGEDTIQVDDDAAINKTERGSWIAAWLWIEDPLARSDLED